MALLVYLAVGWSVADPSVAVDWSAAGQLEADPSVAGQLEADWSGVDWLAVDP
jgi:hypothetical protein